ncbi:other/FunK1 protein kinase [Coprinopsis cinerea okayama7|uniref:Other/FunK1 protein kinase n=1 Tax=Coprinopsis cinerea (strain Okayama-7 / 130 / ATCC MYA-4618 / FGSC 9003) TaxID=240176 RepID=A8NB22_COPC7|nr:other/FunK1 protein kinase [Coprinopsis cinerea okayama7\|eukprot:XP_001832024.1 other/FunK1 protein kinase [Coprinopsis cinerea okayama7\
MTEMQIQHRLFADVRAFRDSDWQKSPAVKDYGEEELNLLADALDGDRFKRFFCCILDKYVGKPSRSLCPKGSIETNVFPEYKAFKSHNSGEFLPSIRTGQSTAKPKTLKKAEDANLTRAFDPRRQCRFIMESVCTPLSQVETLGEAVDIIKVLMTGLRIMFCAGWIHRDISPGNILAWRASESEPWQAKLSDLEYSKKLPYTGPASRDPKTGTPYFMPCEVLKGAYFLPRSTVNYRDDNESGAKPAWDKENSVTPNYQHDLESIWWILLWKSTARAWEDAPIERDIYVFQKRVTDMYTNARAACFRVPLGDEAKIMSHVPPRLELFVGQHLDFLRSSLYYEYESRAKEDRDNIGSYSWVMSKPFTRFFARVEESREEWGSLKLVVDKQVRKMEDLELVSHTDTDEPSTPAGETIGVSEEGEATNIEHNERAQGSEQDVADPDIEESTSRPMKPSGKKRKATDVEEDKVVDGRGTAAIHRAEEDGDVDDKAQSRRTSKRLRSARADTQEKLADTHIGRVTRSMTKATTATTQGGSAANTDSVKQNHGLSKQKKNTRR